jgi:hypothetical protein
MTCSTLSEEQIYARVKDAFDQCIPPITFDSIEAGDFADGLRIIALIDFVKNGQAKLGTKKLNIYQLRPILDTALGSIGGRFGTPSFNLQSIMARDKAETIKLLQWILMFLKPKPVLPIDAWLVRVGICAVGTKPIINLATFTALAERFGLNGNPFEAFREAGIPIPFPDNPSTALDALFRLYKDKKPGEIIFVHDAGSEAELSRIHDVVMNLPGLDVSSVDAEAKIHTDILADVNHLRWRLDLPIATDVLAARTNKILKEVDAVLNRRGREIKQLLHDKRQQNETAAKQAADEFEHRATEADDRIATMVALAAKKPPKTFREIKERIAHLNMETATESFEVAAQGPRWPEKRIEDLGRRFTEAGTKVTQARTEYQELLHSIQTEKREKHLTCLTNIKAMLRRTETTIDERTGDFEKRCSILRDQDLVLQEQYSFVVQQGKLLDDDLRNHEIDDFEPIIAQDVEVLRLREKVRGSIEEEEEVEKRRVVFSEALELRRTHFESIERVLQSITFEPLAEARRNKWHVIDCQVSITNDGRAVNEAWETLIAVRAFPEEPVNDFRVWMDTLLKLCETNLGNLEEAIPRLEAEGISNFVSQIRLCQSMKHDTARLYAQLPSEPRLRAAQLSQMVADLQREEAKASKLFELLQAHHLDQQIAAHDAASLRIFRRPLDRYGREISILTRYLSVLDRFHSEANILESEIARVRQEADVMLITDDPLRNIRLYRDFVHRNDAIFRNFLRVREQAIVQAYESGQSDEDIRLTQDRLEGDYRATLRDIRDLITALATDLIDIPDAWFERDHEPRPLLRWTISRSNAIDDFVDLVVRNHEQYSGETIEFHISGEEGLDVGGLSREIITIICEPLLRRALVEADAGDILWFPENGECDLNRKNDLTAVGFLIGLAIRNEQSVTSLLPIPFFRALKSEPMTLRDLQTISPEAHSSIEQVRTAYDEGENLDLYLEDGREVTADSVESYISENLKTRMETSVSEAVSAVKRGFCGGKAPNWISSFSWNDLSSRIRGRLAVNWTEMNTSCALSGYSQDDIPVILFWKVFWDLTEEEKVALLTFITSSNRPPAAGFTSHPIRLVKCEWNPVTQMPLPRAHTCFRTLDLPNVMDEETMKRLVQICIEYNQGFGMI